MTKPGLGLPRSDDGENEPIAEPQETLENEDEEDDYMSMAIEEPKKPYQKETYTQRRIRKQREVSAKLHPMLVVANERTLGGSPRAPALKEGD